MVIVLHNGPSKINIKPREVTHELLIKEGITFHTHQNDLIPNYPQQFLLLTDYQIHNEQNLRMFQDSDTTDINQND